MTILKPCPVSTRQLAWEPLPVMYYGDVSSTNGFGRVYDDAEDLGLTLISSTTGAEVVFVITDTEVIDGEIVSWTLTPADPTNLANPGITVLLYND